MKKTAIIYGEYAGVQKKALEILSKYILEYTDECPTCIKASDFTDDGSFRCIYTGTRDNNRYIASRAAGRITESEGYSVTVENDTVFIEGSDSNGVLYGCVDFYNKYILKYEYTHDSGCYHKNIFHGILPDFKYSSAPIIKNRGLWTWGHTITDYRGYLDNMVMLKMNEVIIWNDHLPVNIREIVEYAHLCGIRIIPGYAWFWDTNCGAVDICKAMETAGDIFEKYESEYRDIGFDGIYFQSFTELDRENIGEHCIAEAVVKLVNKASAPFFEKYPDIDIQFGLHANSVSEKLEFIAKTDKRIKIIWENCGCAPFDYIPLKSDNFDATVNFVQRITHLRDPGERFGAVTKSLTKLFWSEFEHQKGRCVLGASTDATKRMHEERKRKIWKYIQSCWLANAEKILEMVRVIAKETGGNTDITALCEDGMFEEHIYYPVALYSEMLWNPYADIKQLMYEVGIRDYVEFAG